MNKYQPGDILIDKATGSIKRVIRVYKAFNEPYEEYKLEFKFIKSSIHSGNDWMYARWADSYRHIKASELTKLLYE